MTHTILGWGVDVLGVGRVERAVARHGEGFLGEFLRPSETSACFQSSRPLSRCASLFAAKEAFFKALGTGKSGRLRWTDLEVCAWRGRVPALALSGEAERWARQAGVRRVHLDVASCGGRVGPEMVAAVVVLEG